MGCWRILQILQRETMQETVIMDCLLEIENNLKNKTFLSEQARMAPKKSYVWETRFHSQDLLPSNFISSEIWAAKHLTIPKYKFLIKDLIKMMTILIKMHRIRFLLGSATTAHADTTQRRRKVTENISTFSFPKKSPIKKKSAGYKTIPEIAKERIRRSGAK